MDYVNAFLLFLILFTVAVDRLLKRLSQPSKKDKRAWPVCLNCKKGCYRMPTLGFDIPEEITYTLQKYDLPEVVVTRYMCESGCSYIWHIPRLGNMERGVMRTVRIR